MDSQIYVEQIGAAESLEEYEQLVREHSELYVD